ncbi:MAG: hypothetical protein KF736_11635 [Acidobacteria bacterium]|nr:hypothetical protein [Acidobacteriota bacterium]MCW5949943.1 hypothetical protein [Pyrinomonadaceae bacterium]
MSKGSDNSLARLDRPKRNISTAVLSAALLVLLGGLLAASAAEGFLAGVILSGLSIAAFILLSLLHIARARRETAVDDRRFIRWNAALPEMQRQSVMLEVRELARLLEVGNEQLPDLLSAYIVAEDLALRQIQQEEDRPLLRHVSIGKVPFDAIIVNGDLVTCVEVAFLVAPDLRPDKIDAVIRKISTAKGNLHSMRSKLRLDLMLVLVTQLSATDEELLRDALITRRFSETPVEIDIRMLDFEMLQKVYLSEG